MPKAPSRKRVYKLGPRSARTARVLSGMQTWLPCFYLFMNVSLGVRPDVTQLTSRSILFPCNIIDRRHSELMCLFDSSSSKQCFFVCESQITSTFLWNVSKHNNGGLAKRLEILAGKISTRTSSKPRGRDNIAATPAPSTRKRGEASATTNMYRGSNKILQLQCKRNRRREGTPTADFSRKCCQYNSQQDRSVEATLEVYSQMINSSMWHGCHARKITIFFSCKGHFNKKREFRYESGKIQFFQTSQMEMIFLDHVFLLFLLKILWYIHFIAVKHDQWAEYCFKKLKIKRGWLQSLSAGWLENRQSFLKTKNQRIRYLKIKEEEQVIRRKEVDSINSITRRKHFHSSFILLHDKFLQFD